MTIPVRFDHRHGKGAFVRLCSMLYDSALAYEQIGSKFGLTKERIGQLAKVLRINGRQRERNRISRRGPRIKSQAYPPDVTAVISKIRRFGIQVDPYNLIKKSRPRVGRRSKRLVLVNGSICSIQVRKGQKLTPSGREYARFDVTGETKRAKVALWGVKNGGPMKLYVIPLSHLRNVSVVYIPAGGRYGERSSKKPRKDWTRYEEAWQLLGVSRNKALCGDPHIITTDNDNILPS
jgi:hypothetical protein